MLRKISPVAAFALLLAACNQQPAEEAVVAPEPVGPVEPVAPLATAEESAGYTCEKDLPITAVYGTNAEGQPDAALVINGISYDLVETPAATGKRYTTARGLEEGKGLIWEVQGDKAVLYEAPSDRLEDATAAAVLKNCDLQK